MLCAMSHALTHPTPNSCTPSSPVLVLRSLTHCEDPQSPQGGASAEPPPLADYESNRIVANRIIDIRIVDDLENMHFTEDDQITELEDRVKSLSFNQSFLLSTHDSAESIATFRSDFDDEQLRALLASPTVPLGARNKCSTFTSLSLGTYLAIHCLDEKFFVSL